VTWPEVYLQAKWMDWRHVLEIGNGLISIVSIYLVVFLAYHLIKVGVQRRAQIGHLPASMQIALGIWVTFVGVLMTRVVPWASRFTNDGYIDLKSIETMVFSIGVFVTLIGAMCVLRITTRPMIGHWPWVSCLCWCVIYLSWTLVRLS
jgi:hypothetical protein